MKHILLPALVIGLLAAVCPAGAETDTLTIRGESLPEVVILYPGNLVFGTDRMRLPDGEAEILLPAQIIPESLTVFDGGTLLSGYRTRLDPSTGRYLLVISPSGKGRDLGIGYLFRGASWTPVYTVTVLGEDKIRLDFTAAVSSNSLTLKDTELRLLSGLILSEDMSTEGLFLASMTQNNLGYIDRRDEAPGRTPQISAVGDHHIYPAGRVSLLPGDRLVLSVSSMELEARKVPVWDTRNGDRTDTVWKITNSTGIPLPPGLVRLYQEGIYIGSDPLEWTPSGGEGSLTASGMTGLRVRKQVSQETSGSGGSRTARITVTLTVENLSGEKVPLTILDPKEASGNQFDYGRKPVEQPGNILRWDLVLDPGKKEEIVYRYVIETY